MMAWAIYDRVTNDKWAAALQKVTGMINVLKYFGREQIWTRKVTRQDKLSRSMCKVWKLVHDDMLNI